MGNQQSPAVQIETLKLIWRRYRAQAKTSRRLKSEQGWWRQVLLVASVVALLATPFAKTLRLKGPSHAADVLVVAATVLFALVAWLNKEILGDDSQQPWVLARQTAEGLKSLAFRFLGGVASFAGPDSATLALSSADQLATKRGGTPDDVNATEEIENLPPVPLSVPDYLQHRLDDQVAFYRAKAKDERNIEDRIVKAGRLISFVVALFGALGAVIAKEWRDIWAPALGVASALMATQTSRSRHRFLAETYSMSAMKLETAKTAWSISGKTDADATQLVTSVESTLSEENAGWVQQMLLEPMVPDRSASVAAPEGAS